MPVVLFAYVNNLVELKSLSVRKYDLRRDLNKDILRDDVFNQTRTKEGIRGKVALGQYPYHAPFGYENLTIKGQKYKKMVIDKDIAFYIRHAFSLFNIITFFIYYSSFFTSKL